MASPGAVEGRDEILREARRTKKFQLLPISPMEEFHNGAFKSGGSSAKRKKKFLPILLDLSAEKKILEKYEASRRKKLCPPGPSNSTTGKKKQLKPTVNSAKRRSSVRGKSIKRSLFPSPSSSVKKDKKSVGIPISTQQASKMIGKRRKPEMILVEKPTPEKQTPSRETTVNIVTPVLKTKPCDPMWSVASKEFVEMEKKCGIRQVERYPVDKILQEIDNLEANMKKIQAELQLQTEVNLRALNRLRLLVGGEQDNKENKKQKRDLRETVLRKKVSDTDKSLGSIKSDATDVVMSKATKYYNSLRSDFPMLGTPKPDRAMLQRTPSAMKQSVSINLQRQCLLLYDTPMQK